MPGLGLKMSTYNFIFLNEKFGQQSAPNLLSTLSSRVNIIGEAMYDHLRKEDYE